MFNGKALAVKIDPWLDPLQVHDGASCPYGQRWM
jgi:hypothetical protein